MKTTRKTQFIPPDEKPRHLRAFMADVEKQQAVVEAFRVRPPSSGGAVLNGADLNQIGVYW